MCGGIGLGVQLHPIGTQLCRKPHGGRLGVHEETDPDAQGAALGNERSQQLAIALRTLRVPHEMKAVIIMTIMVMATIGIWLLANSVLITRLMSTMFEPQKMA